MTVRVSCRLTDTLADVPARQFDRLGDGAGAAGSYGRLRQHEADARWRVRYAVAESGGRFVAVVPCYSRRGDHWPGEAYDVCRWGLPEADASALSAARCAFVGGCADLRASLHVAPEHDPHQQVRLALRLLAATAAQGQQFLVFPYFSASDRHVIDLATSGRVSWTLLGREAWFCDPADLYREERIPARVRGVLRRDRRLIAAAAPRTTIRAWTDVAAEASELISAHNAGKGARDHQQFAALRHEQWARCEQTELIAFTAATQAVRGVLTAILWRQSLELYEIGLDGPAGPDRLAVYLSLMFHQPMELASDRGLRCVRAGLAAEVPKKSRGAILREVYGGVLSAADTRQLADD